MKLFPGAKTVEKVSEFEDCEHYRQWLRRGLLTTLGKPLRKDAMMSKKDERKRKHELMSGPDAVMRTCKNCDLLQAENTRLLAQNKTMWNMLKNSGHSGDSM